MISLVRIGGATTELAYDDVGVGTPVVFIHGFPLDRRMWAPQLGPLVDHARAVALDLRGFGESAVQPPYTMDQYADDVAALMTALDIPKAVICGLSMGGYVAFAFWRRHRDRVRACVFSDTRLSADGDEARQKRQEMIDAVKAKGSGAAADRMLTGLIGKSTREKSPEIVDHVHAIMENSPPEGVTGALEAMLARPDSTDTLESIDVPCLVICGDEDAITPPSEARAIHEKLRFSQLEIISGAGHLANMERPAAFNHVLGEFLTRLAYD